MTDFIIPAILVVTIAIISVFGIVAAANTPPSPCKRYHTQVYTTFIMSGKVMIPITQQMTVCDG